MSYSGARDYLSCPLLYWYRHHCGYILPGRPLQLVFGSALHKALEMYHTKKKDPVDIFKSEFTLDAIDSIPAKKYKEELSNGIRLLAKYLGLAADLGLTKEITSSESKFSIPLLNPSTGEQSKFCNRMTGIVDYMKAEQKTLGDYKTSSKKYTQEMIDESLQPTFYAYWYYMMHGELPAAFEYIVFRKNIKREPIQILKTARTMEDITALFYLIEEIAKKIDAGLFKRTRHEKYDFCDCKKYDEFILMR